MQFLSIRLSPELKNWFVENQLSKSNNYVVASETAAREHFHVVYDSPVGADSVKKYCQTWCKENGLQVSKGKANAWYGASKPCGDLEKALSYILKDHQDLVGIEVKGWTHEYLLTIPKWIQREDLIVAQDLSSTTVVVREKRQTMREKFVRYLHEEKEWEYYTRNPTSQEVFKECFHFWEGAFTNPQGIVICRHALYLFSDRLHQDQIQSRIYDKICYDI